MHKDWGTTGYCVNTAKVTEPMTSWKDFWDQTQGKYTGRATVHDYQLTTIGNALKYYGYSFNSNDEKQLAEAEKLLLASQAASLRHHQRLSAGDAQRRCLARRSPGRAMPSSCTRTSPSITYVIGKEGGEIWADFYAVPKGAPIARQAMP